MKSLRNSVLEIKPIGVFRKGIILVDQKWTKALQGIEDFSHIIVLFWLHQAHEPDLLVHPQRIQAIPKVGMFATRTPHRPNPIGLTVVELVKRRGRSLRVEGMDAWDETPILDIKPYTKREDVSSYHLPEWLRVLDKGETEILRKYGTSLERAMKRTR